MKLVNDTKNRLPNAPATLLVPEWKKHQPAAAQLAGIRPAKAKLDEKLAAIDQLPATLLRETFTGRF